MRFIELTKIVRSTATKWCKDIMGRVSHNLGRGGIETAGAPTSGCHMKALLERLQQGDLQSQNMFWSLAFQIFKHVAFHGARAKL